MLFEYDGCDKFEDENEMVELTKEEQREKAIKLMEKLGLKPNTIRQFADSGTVYKSVNGKLLPLTKSERQAIQAHRIIDSDCLIYHVIENTMVCFGEKCHFFNLLFVWPFDEETFPECYELNPTYSGQRLFSIMADCINQSIPELSETSSIMVVNNNGVLERIG